MIRRAGIADARVVAEVHVASTRAAYTGVFGTQALAAIDVDERAERWRAVLRDGKSTVLVAESADEILGFVDFGPCRDPDAAGFLGEVFCLYIAPDSQGLGVGRALMNQAIADLAQAGHAFVAVWVLEANARGLAFYRRIGFEPDGRRKTHPMYGATLPAIRLRTAAAKTWL